MSALIDNPDQGVGIDLRAVAATLWVRRAWIIVSVVVFAAGFTAAAFLMTPIYRATAVLVAAGPEQSGGNSLTSALGQFGGLASVAGINLSTGGSQVEETLAVLRSRDLTEAFIRDEQLLPELFPKRWDSETHRWKDGRVPSLAQAFQYFDTHVRAASLDKKTGLINLQIEWRDPVKAARWANELVARVNAEMRARAITSTSASVGYLEKELATTSNVETRQAISRLMEAQINKRMVANVTQEYALRVVDKALPPDPKDRVRPNRLLLLTAGPIFGLMFGAFIVLMAGAFSGGRWK